MSEVYNRHLAARWGFTQRVAACRNILSMSGSDSDVELIDKGQDEIHNNNRHHGGGRSIS